MAESKHIPAILAGARTPFLDTAGAYGEMMAFELGAEAIRGVMNKTGIDAGKIDMVSMGIVVHEIETTNVTREAMLAAGLPSSIPAYTTAMAGLSPNIGVANLSDMISLGRINFALAGGMETFSDVPIRLSPNVRRTAMKMRQAKTGKARLKALSKLRPSDISLDIPKSWDYTTRKTMGQATEAMVQKFHVTREDTDRYALQSHQRAVQAASEGHLAPDLITVKVKGHAPVSADNTPRSDISLEKLASLKPAFDKKAGIITAGNASRFTDGAAALLLGSLHAAEREGLEPLAVVRDYQFTGVDDMHTEMLLGPAMAIPRLLNRHNLNSEDVDVWEVHEAFSAQILVNQVCLADDRFARERHGLKKAVGAMPEERLNIWGGSLALGNPFAATGGRLLMTAARRLKENGGRYAVVSSCAGGGLGTAILLENADKL